ncbi:esterase/lipase family protein [Nocardia sp. NPDC006044]|uniref:esterase/lipase family protein n=1 Tax=Nocardia sp. NPDC006044 TaxID=3364306 RepID=UPI0036C88028
MARCHTSTRLRHAGKALGLAVAFVVLAAATAPGASAAPLPERYRFLTGVADELRNPGGSQPGTNDFGCVPPAAHPNPVVLVHGTGGSRQTNWSTYAPMLKNQGYCVFALTYGTLPGPWPLTSLGGMARMEDSAAQLGAFVDRVLAATGAAKVDIVGHSQGTLMPDYYAKYLGGASKIGKYVALGPVWHGAGLLGYDVLTPFARGLGIPDGKLPVCAACGQLAPDSAFIAAINANGGPYVPGIEYVNIITRLDDPFVGEMPSGPNVRNIVVQEGCPIDVVDHANLAGSRRAAVMVSNVLDPAHQRAVPCQQAVPLLGTIP